MEQNSQYEAYEIYPTVKGWKFLKSFHKKSNKHMRLDWIKENFDYYTNHENDSFKLVFDAETRKELLPKFNNISNGLCRKLPIRVESPMEEYLRIKGITLKEFEQRMAAIACIDD